MNISNSSSSLKSKMFRMTVIFQTAVGVGGVQVGAVAEPTSDLHDAGAVAGNGKKFDIRQWNRSSAATSVKMESFMGFNIRECMAGLLKKNDAGLLASVESNKLKPHAAKKINLAYTKPPSLPRSRYRIYLIIYSYRAKCWYLS